MLGDAASVSELSEFQLRMKQLRMEVWVCIV